MMSVLIEAFSVIIRNESIERFIAGGRDAFVVGWPSGAICGDESIIRIAFMDPSDLREILLTLGCAGLRFGIDFATVCEGSGLDGSSEWLAVGQRNDGLTIAWLNGTDPNRVVVPESWRGESRFRYVSVDDASERFSMIGYDSGVEVFRENETGELYYKGQPAIERLRNSIISQVGRNDEEHSS